MMEHAPKNLFASLFKSFKSKIYDGSANKSRKSEGAFFQDCSRRRFLKALGLGALFLESAAELVAIDVKGVYYIPVSKIARRFGMKYKTTIPKKRQQIYSSNFSMTFDVHRRDMDLNGVKVWLGDPVVEMGGLLYVSSRDIEKTITPIVFPKVSNVPPPLRYIMIDPGHGGKDKGAISKTFGVFEKNLTLDISSRIAAYLRKMGFKVSLTRYKDVFLELPERPAKANKVNADLFLSIHINAAGPSASGVETYSLTPKGQTSTNASTMSVKDKRNFNGEIQNSWNTLLSYYIQSELKEAASSSDRGSKRARFAVLQDGKMPAALVECGFISNNAEARKLCSASYRDSLAKAIANGILRYSKTLKRLNNQKP